MNWLLSLVDIKSWDQTAYKAGLAAGLEQGIKKGANEGYTRGYTLGEKEGVLKGQETAGDKMYIEGIDDGYKSGHERGEHEGYKLGFQAGKQKGDETGYFRGLDRGFDDGWDAAEIHVAKICQGRITQVTSGPQGGEYAEGRRVTGCRKLRSFRGKNYTRVHHGTRRDKNGRLSRYVLNGNSERASLARTPPEISCL